ncbi:MAG: hypothetical protein EBY09_02465 [Verrucomicrobia bacterium]|nr:hypothetical protein [Verrucomicrobiota bacterium]NBU10183.1 hypothetical protein [Pseudomonadota bacterium]NDA65492.1 hypothetical protein [Verrucomicrobiota bacterium]NDE97612.1 hypothetical protein [Verrucomicrobiota bacterium]
MKDPRTKIQKILLGCLLVFCLMGAGLIFFFRESHLLLTLGKPSSGFGRVWYSITGSPVTPDIRSWLHNNTTSVEFSPDGNQLVTAHPSTSWETDIKIWDASTGRELLQIPPQRASGSISFSSDGRHLISEALNGQLNFLHARSGSLAFTLADSLPPDLVSPNVTSRGSIAVSQNARLVAVPRGLWNTPKPFIEVWDIASRKKVLTLENVFYAPWNLDHRLRSAIFSPDSKQILVVDKQTYDLRLCDVETGETVRTLKGFAVGPICIDYSRNGKRIIASYGGRDAKLWNAQSGEEIPIKLNGDSGLEWEHVALSPDGNRLAKSCGNAVKVWDLASGNLLLALKGFPGLGTRPLVFSPDGNKLLGGAWLGPTVKVWDVTPPSPRR